MRILDWAVARTRLQCTCKNLFLDDSCIYIWIRHSPPWITSEQDFILFYFFGVGGCVGCGIVEWKVRDFGLRRKQKIYSYSVCIYLLLLWKNLFLSLFPSPLNKFNSTLVIKSWEFQVSILIICYFNGSPSCITLSHDLHFVLVFVDTSPSFCCLCVVKYRCASLVR